MYFVPMKTNEIFIDNQIYFNRKIANVASVSVKNRKKI